LLRVNGLRMQVCNGQVACPFHGTKVVANWDI